MLRFLGWLFTVGFMLFVGTAAALAFIIWDASKDLPDYKQLATYEPPVMTRIHAGDGSLLAEYAEERRLFVPVSQMPKRMIEAFISAEDKTFFTHGGLDWQGIASAAVRYVQVKMTGRGQIVGASTITSRWPRTFCSPMNVRSSASSRRRCSSSASSRPSRRNRSSNSTSMKSFSG